MNLHEGVEEMSRPGLRLSEAQEEELGQAYQPPRARKDLDMVQRIQGLLPVNDGMSEKKAARIVGVGHRTLQDWIFKFRRGGLEALVKGPFPGRRPKLTPEQFEELAVLIEQGPEEVGLDTGVWTSRLVVNLVRKRFGVKYHPDHMRKILRRLGFSVQVPKRLLSRADPEEESQWLDQELAGLKKKSKRSAQS
jgi:transposase